MQSEDALSEFPALHSSVKVSPASRRDLPLDNFQAVVVVEPNPESWMISDAVYGWAEEIDEQLSDEMYRVAAHTGEPPLMAWIRTYSDEPLFAGCAENARLVVLPGLETGEEAGVLLKDLLHGLKSRMPSAQVAVVGAALEDEVVWSANLCADAGLPTTVVSRYCLSAENFIDMDAIQHEEHRERVAHRILTGEEKGSWLDQLSEDRARKIADRYDLDLSAAGFDESLARILRDLGLEALARVEISFSDPDDPDQAAGPAIHFWQALVPGAISLYRATSFGGEYWRVVRWYSWKSGEREDFARAHYSGDQSKVALLKAKQVVVGSGCDILRDALGIALQAMSAFRAEQQLSREFELGEDDERLWDRLPSFAQHDEG